MDLQTLKSAEDFAVSTTDKISPAIITTQKAVDPRLAKVPTQRNSASDNYNGDEGMRFSVCILGSQVEAVNICTIQIKSIDLKSVPVRSLEKYI